MASPPPVRELWTARERGRVRLPAQAGRTSRATAHMNAASSRAMAVQVTVVFLPRATNARYRAVSRLCAFHAISRIVGDTRSSFGSFFAPTRGG